MRQPAPYGAGACQKQFHGKDLSTVMHVPSGKQPESGPFARAVSAEVRAVMARHRVSATLLAGRAKMSRSYLGKRLRDEVPFTFNDIEAICRAMRMGVSGEVNKARAFCSRMIRWRVESSRGVGATSGNFSTTSSRLAVTEPTIAPSVFAA